MAAVAVCGGAVAVLLVVRSGDGDSVPMRSVDVRPVVPAGLVLHQSPEALKRRLIAGLGPGERLESLRAYRNQVEMERIDPRGFTSGGPQRAFELKQGPVWVIGLYKRFQRVSTPPGAHFPDPPPFRHGFVVMVDRTGDDVAYGFDGG